jgi:outer membrane lipoprotein-sorting protein
MSIPPTNDDLARAHEAFRENHDAGRRRLLGTLSGEVSHLPALRRQPLSGHWRSKLTAAAVLFVAVTIGFYAFWYAPEQAAYALDDLPGRLLEIKSIYMTGWMFQPGSMRGQDNGAPAKYPVKIFAERPDCYWRTFYGFSGPDATHKNVRVQSGYGAGKGTRRLSVSTNDRTATETTVTPIQNELSTEMLIQIEVPQQLLSGHLRDFVKMGAETVNGALCDVYEYSFFDVTKAKKRLWLDPRTGLPVRIACYDVDKAGRETPTQIIDHVEVNVAASATGLLFNPPKDYRVTKAPRPKNVDPLQPVAIASGSNDDVSLGVWQCFNIDDKAVLLCWYCEAKSGPKTAGATILPEFLLAGTHPCNHKEIASTDAGGHHWNWSLVWPGQGGERIGNGGFSVVRRQKQGGRLTMGFVPLHLKEDRLKAILEEIQRTTNTRMQDSSSPFSLDTLRAQLRHG